MAETIDPYDLPGWTFNAWESAATPERIQKAWADCGLFPFAPNVLLDSGKLDLATSFKKIEAPPLAISSATTPLPDTSQLFRRFPNADEFDREEVTFELAMTREMRPFLDHFISINKAVILPHFSEYIHSLVVAGSAASPAPIFDDPDGPTAPTVSIPLIGSKSSDILNSNNPVQQHLTPKSNKRKRGIFMPHGGLLTQDEIYDKFEQQERGTLH
jgi:hypothetical protein